MDKGGQSEADSARQNELIDQWTMLQVGTCTGIYTVYTGKKEQCIHYTCIYMYIVPRAHVLLVQCA